MKHRSGPAQDSEPHLDVGPLFHGGQLISGWAVDDVLICRGQRRVSWVGGTLAMPRSQSAAVNSAYGQSVCLKAMSCRGCGGGQCSSQAGSSRPRSVRARRRGSFPVVTPADQAAGGSEAVGECVDGCCCLIAVAEVSRGASGIAGSSKPRPGPARVPGPHGARRLRPGPGPEATRPPAVKRPLPFAGARVGGHREPAVSLRKRVRDTRDQSIHACMPTRSRP
jgi:hypothetical protein